METFSAFLDYLEVIVCSIFWAVSCKSSNHCRVWNLVLITLTSKLWNLQVIDCLLHDFLLHVDWFPLHVFLYHICRTATWCRPWAFQSLVWTRVSPSCRRWLQMVQNELCLWDAFILPLLFIYFYLWWGHGVQLDDIWNCLGIICFIFIFFK